jgi:hypothetical protein
MSAEKAGRATDQEVAGLKSAERGALLLPNPSAIAVLVRL